MREPLHGTRFYMSETDSERLPPSESEVTFVGRSNVGKSSLICALCQNKTLAIVSKTPGRTRGINVYEARRGRWLVDLPGYGYAAVDQRTRDYWPKMIGRYLSGRSALVMVYVLLDAERGVGPIDHSLLQWLRENDIRHRIVGTKVDRLSQAEQAAQRGQVGREAELPPSEIFWVSAKKGYGMDALRGDVVKMLGV